MNNTRYPLNNTAEFSEGGALTLYHSTVEFTDITTMMNNQAESGGTIAASSASSTCRVIQLLNTIQLDLQVELSMPTRLNSM